jgi:hypothetical protein
MKCSLPVTPNIRYAADVSPPRTVRYSDSMVLCRVDEVNPRYWGLYHSAWHAIYPNGRIADEALLPQRLTGGGGRPATDNVGWVCVPIEYFMEPPPREWGEVAP